MNTAEVSLLTTTVQAVTEAQFPTWPFTGLHLGMHPHTRKAGRPAHGFEQSEPCANTRTGHILLHASMGLNAYTNRSLAMKFVVYPIPTLPSAVQRLSTFHTDLGT